MAFWADMQAMVSDLLRPDTEGGLGQVTIELTRTVPGVVDPDRDWEAVPPTSVETEQLLAAASGADEYADGTTVLKTDLRIVSAVPTINWRMPVEGEAARLSLTLDGRPVEIIRVRGMPPVGVPVAVEFIARG